MKSHDITWHHMTLHDLTWHHRCHSQVAIQTCSLSRCMPGGPCYTLLSSHSEYSCPSVLDGWGPCDLFVELWVCECEGVRCEGLHSDDVGTQYGSVLNIVQLWLHDRPLSVKPHQSTSHHLSTMFQYLLWQSCRQDEYKRNTAVFWGQIP